MKFRFGLVVSLCLLALASGCREMPPIEWAENPPPNAQIINSPEMKTGDTWVYKYSSHSGSIADDRVDTWMVTSLNMDGSYVMFRENRSGSEVTKLEYLYDKDHRILKKTRLEPASPFKFLGDEKMMDFPMWIGKRWEARYQQISTKGAVQDFLNKYTAMDIQDVQVKAGIFQSMHVFYNHQLVDSGRTWEREFWYSPEVRALVLQDNEDWRYELIEFRPGK